MSSDLVWFIVRNNHSRLVKRTGLNKQLSFEKGNLANVHSYHNCGLIHDKTVDVSPNPSGKGVVLTTRKAKAPANQVAKAFTVQTLKAGSSRKNNAAISRAVGPYRKELETLAKAKASGILRSQRQSAASKKSKAPRVRSKTAKKAAASKSA